MGDMKNVHFDVDFGSRAMDRGTSSDDMHCSHAISHVCSTGCMAMGAMDATDVLLLHMFSRRH